MVWLMILGFAASSSLDNLGVGISYGIRKIRVGFLSNLLIAAICFVFSETGILFGHWLSKVIPGTFPVLFGAFLLFIIGVRIILLAMPNNRKYFSQEVDTQSDMRSLVGILRNPERADRDSSGAISLVEAIILGIVLSANAITNGLSAGLLGFSPLAISITAAVGSFITVWFGAVLGRKVSNVRIGSFTLGQFGTLISGVILLVIACNSFF